MSFPLRSFVKNNRNFFVYLCPDCTEEFSQRADYASKSDGRCKPCANKLVGKKLRTHGHNNKNSRLHVTWSNMKRRCLRPVGKEKTIYIGVTLFEPWKQFQAFMEWAISNGYDDTKTIDRIDGSKGYSPENCRFVDYSHQAANRKKSKVTDSGYLGVYQFGRKWRSQVQWRRQQKHIGYFDTALEAAIARDKYITDNKLPHMLNFGRVSH